MMGPMKPGPFYEHPSLNVETYDARTDLAPIEGDVDFYLELARDQGGPILDIGGGTGRVAWPIAAAGFQVTTLDRSEAMLAVSRAKAELWGVDVAARTTFVVAEREIELGSRFGLAIAPFRVLQALLTPDDQRRALERIARHLRPGGLFVAHLFDPLLELYTPMDGPAADPDRGTVRHPSTGHMVEIRVLPRTNDPLAQVLTESWEFRELGQDGQPVRIEEETLRMRWTYRYEMRYLLERAGFAVEAEYSDFHRSPPRYGAEQVCVARRMSKAS